MSFQLVYTSAAHLLTPGMSGYGVVARSEEIPHPLAEALGELCQGHEDEPEALGAPLYTYRLLNCRGQVFHILSCIQDAGADYSSRRCHIAHHLALTEDEVQALRRNSARPTPAGLILALRREGFWHARWEGEARHLTGEPKLTAASLPDASQQATWKELTGHKGNARCLYSPPFDHDCLMRLDAGATPEQCLLLLHECDWLAPGRGWGRSFCTPGYTDGTPLQRTCALPGSVWEARAMRLGHPILAINPALALPPPPEPQASPEEGTAPHAGLPYHYVESADGELYEMTRGNLPLRRYLTCAGAIFLVGAGMYIGISDQADDIGSAARDTMRHISAGENLEELRNLLGVPFSTETTRARLERLRARSATAGSASIDEATRLCIDTLCHAGDSPERLADAPPRLAVYAEALQLPRHELLRFALLLATEGRDVEDWRRKLTPEARQAWVQALSTTPQAATWLADTRLTAFLRAMLPAEAGTPGPAAEAGAEPPPPPIAAPLRPHSHTATPSLAVQAGHPAPPILLHTLRRAPLALEAGDFILCRWEPHQASPAHRAALAPGSGSLHIIPGEAEGEYFLRPDEASGQDWEVRLRVEDGIVTALEEGGVPAALKLPLRGAAGEEVSVLLLPRVEILLAPREASRPPGVPTAALRLTEADLQVVQPVHSPGQPRLMLARDKAHLFPWVPMETPLELEQGRLYLPDLGRPNVLHPLPVGSGLPYNWDAAAEEDGSYSLRLRRVHDFSHALHGRFLSAANSPCGGDAEGGKPGSTLARLYALSLDMEKRNLRQQAIGQYIRLFDDREFGIFMLGVLRAAPHWVPLPTSAHESVEQARSRVSSALSSTSTRRAFRQMLRAAITQRLHQAYQEEWQRMARQADGPLRLVPGRVELRPDGSLLWQVNLETPLPADGTPKD